MGLNSRGGSPSIDKLASLARSYAEGDNAAGTFLIESVNEQTVPALPQQIRATLMDAIMAGNKSSLTEQESKLLRAALYATSDDSYLAAQAQVYLDAGEQMAAETLLEWRVVLQERNLHGGDKHIEALIALADVYVAGEKWDKAAALREAAAITCKQRSSKNISTSELLNKIAQSCYDAGDYRRAEKLLALNLNALEQISNESRDSKHSAELIDCLRLMHSTAQKQQRFEQALSIADRIQDLQGNKDGIDEIDRLLSTYAKLPDYFELKTRPDGIDLFTDNFPLVVRECSGLDLEKYFLDAFAEKAELTASERTQLAEDLFGVFLSVKKFTTSHAGATFGRLEETSITLPSALSHGYVQKVSFGTEITFRMVPNPPDEVRFVNVTGITFSAGGKLIRMAELTLKADGNKCVVTPLFAECGQIKQGAGTAFEALSNICKDFLIGLFLRASQFTVTLPIVPEDYRAYLVNLANIKRSLQYTEKDLLSFFERCSRIEVADPLTRAIFSGGQRLCRRLEEIEIDRNLVSSCDLGGVVLRFPEKVKLKVARKLDELDIPEIQGVDVSVKFDAPPELRAIGLNLRRSLPTHIESLKLSAPRNHLRHLVAETGPGRWIGLEVQRNMNPAIDKNGNWTVLGVASNPISGAPQRFFLRLNRNNELKMTTREIADLVGQTAIEGLDPADPLTWKWGAVAIGAQTVLTVGSVLRTTIGDEETDEIVDEVHKIVKSITDLLF